MKKQLFLTVVLALMLQVTSNAQSIKLNNEGDPGSAMLEVNSSSKGILIPNVSLTGSTDVTTIILPAASLLVYNTATVSDVEPGYYYNSGTSVSPVWTRLSTGTGTGTAGDGSETKVREGANVTITGSGTSASPYAVNAITAKGTSAGQIEYWNGTAWVMIEPTVNHHTTLQKINGVPTWTGGYTIPDAPTIGTATAGAGQATITYAAPGSNGGAAITSYTATSSPGGITGTVTQSGSGSITVIGLTNGTAYTFTVTATNAAGSSVASAASNAVTLLWASTNLDVSTYRDGTAIPRVEDGATWANLTTGAYCYYFNDSTTYAAIYGKLYNRYAVAGIHDNDPNTANKTLAPEGWHVPTDGEWTTLTSYFGGESVAGGKMKEVGVSHWVSPNTGATNESGFSGLPGGYRAFNGSFYFIGHVGHWWSSSEYNTSDAWHWYLVNSSDDVSKFSSNKGSGFSVRCLKTTIPDAPTIGTATAGAGQATITYAAPGSNGGAAITSYTATSFPGGITGTVTQATSGSITVMGLTPGTSYTFTVTATNAAGSSVASAASNAVTPKVFDNLPSIIIDSQIWTSKNLDVSTYRDGTAIPRVVDGATWAALTTGAYCYYNNDSTTYAAIYGKLYNWYAVAGIHDNDPNTANKTLAPEGWHVPTDSEWTMLTSYLGGESVAGGKMKEVGVSHWVSPNTGATNESGFSGLPGGYRNYDGIFNSNRNNGFWWSSSEYNPTTAWYRGLSNDIGYVYRLNYYKDSGFSGRCLRD
jgi:uncharacterized protein (TIGR02145 family)